MNKIDDKTVNHLKVWLEENPDYTFLGLGVKENCLTRTYRLSGATLSTFYYRPLRRYWICYWPFATAHVPENVYFLHKQNMATYAELKKFKKFFVPPELAFLIKDQTLLTRTLTL